MVLFRLDIIGSRNLKSATDNLRGNFRYSYSEDSVSQPSSIPYTLKSRSATYIAPSYRQHYAYIQKNRRHVEAYFHPIGSSELCRSFW